MLKLDVIQENENVGHKGEGSSIDIVLFMANLPVNYQSENTEIKYIFVKYLLINLHSAHYYKHYFILVLSTSHS